MRKKTGIVRYTADEIRAMRRSGQDLTDEKVVDQSLDDEDEGSFDWASAQIGIPPAKQQLTLRVDRDVVDWFRAQGRGYQTRMNAVLRRFMTAQRGHP